MVPLWSGVHVHEIQAEELARSLSKIHGGCTVEGFPEDIRDAREKIAELVRASRIE